MSRLHEVVGTEEADRLLVCDLDGRRHVVSLLAWEGDRPDVGDWVVAHSGFALCRADPDEITTARADLERMRRQG